jgi:hypothetical protein
MATPSTDSNTISRINSGFPDYLDFDSLRSSSIKYLSGLTGKVWTDYNVHDPGITILEVLTYALMDLGYRTNLPVSDIFAKDPATPDDPNDPVKDSNFFTPAQIFACNPVTITDFRKLLVDIDGVKNAWLEPVSDPAEIKGLYHIKIQPDDQLLRPQEDIISDIKQELLGHRNLCEDFIDISMLCPLEIGVSADIGLDRDYDANTVGKDILLALQSFFSPAPGFYTLQQLLAKNKKIEDIFAGRPLSLSGKATHGFLDIDEFEAITQIKTVHLSDVYNCLLKVDGVKTVRSLQLKTAFEGYIPSWQYKLPDNYVPVFSPDISSLQFTSDEVAIPADIRSISATIAALPGNSGKLPKLLENTDLQVPAGVYHNDLADYYSVQNEFPRVYGIGDGGLGVTATLARQAQALQLKGYLLFFDQLLANYLSQLGNIRNIFSLKSPASPHPSTYFANVLSDEQGQPGYVPDMSKLLFHVDPNNVKSSLGFPIWKKDWDELKNLENITSHQLRKLQKEFQCQTQEEYKLVSGILQTSFMDNALYTISPAVATKDSHYFCWVNFAGSDIVLTSPLFSDKTEATQSIALLPTIASDKVNYNKQSTGDGSCSFTIDLSMPSYSQYLTQVTENKATYEKRRQGFLDHLLSRFAEQFTDFALLSYGYVKKDLLPAAIIKNKENFLYHYPALSSRRGKGIEYRAPTGPENSTGVEKRFKAYAGIDSCACKSLCNFEVAAYEDGYAVGLNLTGFELFRTPGVHEGNASAQAAAQSVLEAMSDPNKYKVELLSHSDKYQVKVLFAGGVATYAGPPMSQEEAVDLAAGLQRMARNHPSEEDIYVNRSEWRLRLANNAGKEIRISHTTFETEAAALAAAIEYLKAPSDETKWEMTDPTNTPSGKFCSNNKRKPQRFIDIDHFKININNTIVGKPDKFNYVLLDKMHTFKCSSLSEFDTEKKARADAYRLLLLMADKNNYDDRTSKTKLYILNNGQRVAECRSNNGHGPMPEFKEKILEMVGAHFYQLSLPAFPSHWKVRFTLGFEKDKDLLFESDAEFDKLEDVQTAAMTFYDDLQHVDMKQINSKYSLESVNSSAGVLTCIHVGPAIETMSDEDKLEYAKRLLQLKKEIDRRQRSGTPIPFEQGIEIDALSMTGAWVYRLVDRDNFLAVHTVSGGNANDELKTLFNNRASAYDVLEICLGGDVTARNTDPSTPLYQYLIKCRKDNGPFKSETILFRSVTTYSSAEEAETAFNANYLDVLAKAMDPENYGPGKFIGLGEPGTAVSVPPETVQMAGADPVSAFVTAARCYPVRINVTKAAECTGNAKEETSFYYTLYNIVSKGYDWKSVNKYTTAQDARQAFYFFMLLLEYKGNYQTYTDYDNTIVIYIREVLAESAHRFGSAEEAWGPKGVERFICVAQTPDAFHGLVQDDGSYTFTVACATAEGIHPFKYGTGAKRDAALEQLFKDFSSADQTGWKPVKSNKDQTEFWVEITLTPSSTPPAYGSACYPTWKSACIYDNQADADRQAAAMLSALGVYENYRPYFDCSCYSYGIALLTNDDIIAKGPQRYLNTETVCEAIARAKLLINCEGAYLVEHILLRSRAAAAALPVQMYSFIATVALPSWPDRFHKKENRQLLEMILYREAPSHVLLNIMWLSPKDTLLFETNYHKWRWTFLQNDPAAIDAASAGLMDFIVNTPNGPPTDCTDCLPCATKNE